MTKKSVMTFLFAVMCTLTIAVTLYSCTQVNESMKIDFETIELVQFEEISDEAPVAVIKTSLGEIKAVLYPEYAPNTVNNFISLAESGYYDNTYVFRTNEDVYFAAGSPNQDGSLNDDYNKENENILNEYHQNLWPFKGALCSLSSNNHGGSRFLVVNTIEFTDEIKEGLLSSSENTLLADAFIEHGGVPNYAQQMTIFGHTYEGLDIVELIASKESDPDNEYIPYEEIMIESIEISTYGEISE